MRKFRYGMMAPFATVFAVAIGFPLVYAVYLSFVDKKLTSQRPAQFTGIDNYTKAFHGKFIGSLGVTATYVVIAVVAELVLALLIALALQRQRWMKDLTRSVLLIPMFITPIAVALVFRFLLNSQLGVIPNALHKIGIDHDFFGSGSALFTLIAIDVWQWTPFLVLLLVAGLESMPKQPLEAAKVDGASGLYTLFRVTLPLLSPVLTVAVMLRALDALKVFEYVYATTRGGPGTETETIQYLMYQTGIQFFRLGEASAMACLVLAFVLAVIVVVYRRMEKSAA
ncbi:carbohydrate ABC transporter permease [Mycolicibacterium peregrinum]|uniref:ABC transporter permease n=2 Tax=Mycolicibacterium peregrinum TaxID=43304 RepID=A0A1A0RBS5_MYCPR|nr:sugar ABC transporter permease [Mycolicibacterium peregrinum]OBB31940.1 ABC transporter permease [Mycolicibacterium peregrinum]